MVHSLAKVISYNTFCVLTFCKKWKDVKQSFFTPCLTAKLGLRYQEILFKVLPKHKFSILFLLLLLACYRTHYRIFTALKSINLKKSHVKKFLSASRYTFC